MKQAIRLAGFILCFYVPAYADDVVQLKSGERMEGKILAETETDILMDSESDGVMIEIPKNTVSILDRTPDPDAPEGQVSFYTAVPKKHKPPSAGSRGKFTGAAQTLQRDATPLEGEDTSPSFDMLDKMFQSWLEKHPKFREWLESLEDRAIQQAAQLNQLADAAKQN